MASKEKQSSYTMLSRPNSIEAISICYSERIKNLVPNVDQTISIASPSIPIAYKASGMEGKGRTTVTTTNDVSPERSVAKSTVAASNFLHDILDDYDYPQGIFVSQLSMSTDEEQPDPVSLGIDGSFSKPASTGQPLSTIASIEYSQDQNLITRSKPVEYFDDLAWTRPQSGIQSPEGADSGGCTRRKAMTISSGRLIDSPPNVPRPKSSLDSRTTSGETFEWLSENILTLSNEIRAALRDVGITGISSINRARLNAMLDRFMEDELKPRAVEFNIIIEGRVDKLLEDLRGGTNHLADEPQLQGLIAKASTLQGNWRKRFDPEYGQMETLRLASLNEAGALHDIILNAGERPNGRRFSVTKGTPVEYIEVGSWWPSMACVYRDGMVQGLDEVVSSGPYGMSWILPIFTGTEEDGPMPGMSRVLREGYEKDMHTRLMLSAGKRVKVLRGHTLKSKYAPTVGIRYDGEYIVEQYGRRPTQDPKVKNLALLLRRFEDQKSINDLRGIPLPSQVDDFLLYTRMIENDIRAREGEEECRKWHMAMQQMAKEKDEVCGHRISSAALESFVKYKLSVVESERAMEEGLKN